MMDAAHAPSADFERGLLRAQPLIFAVMDAPPLPVAGKCYQQPAVPARRRKRHSLKIRRLTPSRRREAAAEPRACHGPPTALMLTMPTRHIFSPAPPRLRHATRRRAGASVQQHFLDGPIRQTPRRHYATAHIGIHAFAYFARLAAARPLEVPFLPGFRAG